MRLHIRARLAARRGKRSVSATPRLRVPTYSKYERACMMCGLDPDAVRRGKQKFTDATAPEDGQALLELVLENSGQFDLKRLDPHLRDELLGVVMAHFFVYALNTFEQQKRSFSATLSEQAWTGSRRAAPPRRWGGHLPASPTMSTSG